MKKSFFLITILFLVLKTSQAAHEGFGAGGMVIDRESFGGGAHGMAASAGTGAGGIVIDSESFGGGTSGMVVGGFDGMRTLDLPTSYVGNFGGSF